MTTPQVPALPGTTPLGFADVEPGAYGVQVNPDEGAFVATAAMETPALEEGEHTGTCEMCDATTIVVFTGFDEDDAATMCAPGFGCRNTDDWNRYRYGR